MKKLALIGKNIIHSKSQKMYEDLLQEKVDYTLLDCNIEAQIPDPEELLNMYDGVSITAPYKRFFIGKVITNDEITKLGSINCLGRFNGEIHGTNTDFLAVLETFKELKGKYKAGLEVCILGDGVMSNMTSSVLKNLDINYKVLSRKKGHDLENLDLNTQFGAMNSHNLVVNSCGRSFVFKGDIQENIFFWDYNYSFNPHSYLKTICQYTDGISLLRDQAKFALQFWDNK